MLNPRHKMRPGISCPPLSFKCHIRRFTASQIHLREAGTSPKYHIRDYLKVHLGPVKPYPREGLSIFPQNEENEITTWKGQASPEIRASGALAGKRAIITGASRGIGAAIAERFAKEGARCVLVGRNKDALQRVKEGLMAAYKIDHVVKVGDVREVEFWKKTSKSEVSAC